MAEKSDLQVQRLVNLIWNNLRNKPAVDTSALLTELQLKADLTETQPVSFEKATSAARTQVASSASVVTILAANTNRKLAVVANDGTQTLYLAFGSGATTSNYSYKLGPDDTLEVKGEDWNGILTGIWDSANGNAIVTETTV